jgi:multidrug efflux pump subunit AcrA (membrane-fusion protein)
MDGKITASILTTALLLASCGAPARENAPPELIAAAGVRSDMAVVERADIGVVEQARGIVRMQSEGLFYTNAPFPFDGFAVTPGQEVREGQLLASLDGESARTQIERQRERLDALRAEYAFENGIREREIVIARLEYIAIIKEANDLLDMSLLESAELKRLDAERLDLELEQALTRQALTLSYETGLLEEMEAGLAGAELRAPYDGVVTYIADTARGSRVEAFRPLVYISDRKNTFVEYAGSINAPLSRNAVVVGVAEGREYALERVYLSAQELLFYSRNQAAAPVRFTVAAPEGELRTGQPVTLYIYSQIVRDALRVPINALYSGTEGQYVYANRDGQKVMTPVETGVKTSAWAEITSGLEEGDVVYVEQ